MKAGHHMANPKHLDILKKGVEATNVASPSYLKPGKVYRTTLHMKSSGLMKMDIAYLDDGRTLF